MKTSLEVIHTHFPPPSNFEQHFHVRYGINQANMLLIVASHPWHPSCLNMKKHILTLSCASFFISSCNLFRMCRFGLFFLAYCWSSITLLSEVSYSKNHKQQQMSLCDMKKTENKTKKMEQKCHLCHSCISLSKNIFPWVHEILNRLQDFHLEDARLTRLLLPVKAVDYVLVIARFSWGLLIKHTLPLPGQRHHDSSAANKLKNPEKHKSKPTVIRNNQTKPCSPV